MKKIIGLCVVLLLSSVSVFAQDQQNGERKGRQRDASKRFEKLADELKLNEKQIAEFQKLNESQKEKMKVEREAIKAEREALKQKMIAMRDQRDDAVKNILTDEQYQLYKEKQKTRMHAQKEKFKKDRMNGDNPHKYKKGRKHQDRQQRRG